MPAAVDQRAIEITGSETVWFTHVPPPGLHTLTLTYPTGVTGSLAVVTAQNPNEPTSIAPAEINGTQVVFASGGAYSSKAVDISGGKAIGIQATGVAGGAAKAYLVPSR